MANEIGGSLIIVCQIALLVGNYVYHWNLPWYLLFCPLLLSFGLIILVIAAVLIGLIIAALAGKL
jgi:hypothetical protein